MPSPSRLLCFALCVLWLPASAQAEPLAELRARLEGQQPAGVLRARIEVRSESRSSEEQHANTGTESVLAELGPEGLRIGWTPAQIGEAMAVAWRQARDPDAARTGASLGQVAAWDALSGLDHTPILLMALDGATLVEQKPDASRGAGGRLLVITPRRSLSKADAKMIKSYDDVLKLWLDADGWPVASERAVKMRGSKFLVSFGFEQKMEREIVRRDGRLVVISERSQGSGDGLGTESSGTTVTTVTVLP